MASQPNPLAGLFAAKNITGPQAAAFAPSSTQQIFAGQASQNPFAMMNFLGEKIAAQNNQDQYLQQLQQTQGLQAGQLAGDRQLDLYKTNVGAIPELSGLLGQDRTAEIIGEQPNQFSNLQQLLTMLSGQAGTQTKIAGAREAAQKGGIDTALPVEAIAAAGGNVTGRVTPLAERLASAKAAGEDKITVGHKVGSTDTKLQTSDPTKAGAFLQTGIRGLTDPVTTTTTDDGGTVTNVLDEDIVEFTNLLPDATRAALDNPVMREAYDAVLRAVGLPRIGNDDHHLANNRAVDKIGLTLFFDTDGGGLAIFIAEDGSISTPDGKSLTGE